ncbi:MAG: hypothetical protein ACFFC7_15160 [Candidatus Hermodarchaeota archaeon]
MSDEYEEYIIFGRLLVILQVFLFPIYFFILTLLFAPDQIPLLLLLDEFYPMAGTLIGYILMKFGAPIVFSIPFFLWSYLWRDQIADTYELMGQRVLKLSIGTLLFYGLNCAIILLFLLPFLAPLIALAGGYFIARLIFGEAKSKKVLLVTVIYIPIPLLIALGFYSGILDELVTFVYLWDTYLPYLYGICLGLADGLVIGSILLLIYEGAKQVDPTVPIPSGFITIISLALGAIFIGVFLIGPEGLALTSLNITFIIHLIAIAIGLGVFAIRFLKGLGEVSGGGYIGWLSIIAFQAVNILSSPNIALFSKSMAVFLAFGLFLLLFIISFRQVHQQEADYDY